MATRFYLNNLKTAPISPSINAGWTVTSGNTYRMLYPSLTQFSVNAGSVVITSGSSGTTPPQKMICTTMISQPLIAQTINSGSTISMQIKASKSAGVPIGLLFVYFRWCDDDGTNIQEIGSASNVTNLTGTATNRTITLTLVSNVVITNNQRLIVEIGESFTVGVSAHTCSISSVMGVTLADLPVDNTTTTALNPWIEFSQTLVFIPSSIVQLI